VLGVAEGEVDYSPPSFGEEARAAFMEDDVRLAGILAPNLQILPAQLGSDAGAEGFGDGFLGGKAGGHERTRITVLQAVGQFGWPENAVDKALPKFCVGIADALHLDDVDPGAENHER
jgi:hypothetical protein